MERKAKAENREKQTQEEKIREILSNPRDQAEELRSLQDTLYVVGGKWRLPIINSICNGNTRFREIARSIPGISTRMLSRELKDMEANGIIKRTVYDDVPVIVEYTATDYCHTFGDIILEMIKWGRSHRNRIKTQARSTAVYRAAPAK